VFVGDVLESGAQATTPLECEEAGAGTTLSGGLAAAAITQVKEVKPAWVELYDSGATRHISPYCDDFVNYRALELPLFLHAANGQRFPAIGTGTMVVSTPNGDMQSKLTLCYNTYLFSLLFLLFLIT
jgi:hypothetical protein